MERCTAMREIIDDYISKKKMEVALYLWIQVSSVEINMVNPLPFNSRMEHMFGRSAKVTAVEISKYPWQSNIRRFENAITSIYGLWALKEKKTRSRAYARQSAGSGIEEADVQWLASIRVTRTPPVFGMTDEISTGSGWTHLGSTESICMMRLAVPSTSKSTKNGEYGAESLTRAINRSILPIRCEIRVMI